MAQQPQDSRSLDPDLEHVLDNCPESADTPWTMLSKGTTFLLLTAIALQAVFGALQGSVIICLGGGHEHGPAEVVEHCDLECSHHSEWPTPVANEEHVDNCDCTDFELGLIVLLATPLSGEHDIEWDAAPEPVIALLQASKSNAPTRRPPRADWDDPGGRQHIAAIRITRLLI